MKKEEEKKYHIMIETHNHNNWWPEEVGTYTKYTRPNKLCSNQLPISNSTIAEHVLLADLKVGTQHTWWGIKIKY